MAHACTAGDCPACPQAPGTRQLPRAGALRDDLLVFVRRCLAYATTYRSSASQPARPLSAAGPALLAIRQALESWRPSEDLDAAAADTLTQFARSCLETLELHAPNGDWDAFRGRSPPQSA